MTRKHFKALAEAMRRTRPNAATFAYSAWLKDVAAIADVCAASNPRFDRERFMDTAGGL